MKRPNMAAINAELNAIFFRPKPKRFRNVIYRVSVGKGVSQWLREEAGKKKISVEEMIRRIVYEKGDFF